MGCPKQMGMPNWHLTHHFETLLFLGPLLIVEPPSNENELVYSFIFPQICISFAKGPMRSQKMKDRSQLDENNLQKQAASRPSLQTKPLMRYSK